MSGLRQLLLASMVFLMLGFVTLAMMPRRANQPVAFNHRLHVAEVGAACTDCHHYAETGVRATIPNTEDCAECHEEAQGESPEEAMLVEVIAAGESIPWVKVYHVPDHVFFSHRRHTAIAGLECAVCHGEVGERNEPVRRQEWAPTMDNCMECHERSGASNDCIYCHY